jgi:hypothetical protein
VVNGQDHDFELRYSADLPTGPGAARPPGDGDIVRIRDVLVIPGRSETNLEGVEPTELATFPTYDPARGREDAEPIDLGGGLVLTKLDEAERVITACSSRGHYFVPVRQFGQMYSFVREIDLGEMEDARWAWDRENVIRDAVAMSRLILDNGYSTEYGARVFDYSNGEQQVMPIRELQHAYRLRPTAREWMTTAEAHELRDLLADYWALNELPDRVAHAIWHSEYLVSARWLDVIAPLLVVAFEALVNTSTQLVTRQFTQRVPRMTEEAGAAMSATLCSHMYDTRSRWVHGDRVPLYRRSRTDPGKWEGPTDDEQRAALDRIPRTQDGLRAVLRKAIREPEFRAIFATAETIRQRWPVAV